MNEEGDHGDAAAHLVSVHVLRIFHAPTVTSSIGIIPWSFRHHQLSSETIETQLRRANSRAYFERMRADAIQALETPPARKAKLIEMRFFRGMTAEVVLRIRWGIRSNS